MRPSGIVILSTFGPYLGYGWKHGFGCGWLPNWVQGAIVGGWNRLVCAFRGHVALTLQADEDFPEGYHVPCLMCGVDR